MPETVHIPGNLPDSMPDFDRFCGGAHDAFGDFSQLRKRGRGANERDSIPPFYEQSDHRAAGNPGPGHLQRRKRRPMPLEFIAKSGSRSGDSRSFFFPYRPWASGRRAVQQVLQHGSRHYAAVCRNLRETMWWARRDLNPQPRDYESPALTVELQAP